MPLEARRVPLPLQAKANAQDAELLRYVCRLLRKMATQAPMDKYRLPGGVPLPTPGLESHAQHQRRRHKQRSNNAMRDVVREQKGTAAAPRSVAGSSSSSDAAASSSSDQRPQRVRRATDLGPALHPDELYLGPQRAGSDAWEAVEQERQQGDGDDSDYDIAEDRPAPETSLLVNSDSE